MNLVQNLINSLQKLPGVGPRASQKLALHLLQNPQLLSEVSESTRAAFEQVKTCHFCHNIDTQDPCSICQSTTRDHDLICIVESVNDIWAMERSKEFQGLYFSLNGNLSSKTYNATMSRIDFLTQHTSQKNVREIILALSNTFDGQTTAQILLQKLSNDNVQISQLAHGIPVGANLDYMDRDTLTMSLKARRHFR